jgi:hypothetical protein
MPISSTNVVLLGENFPVSSLRLEDFEFRHRVLRETLRLPVALRAETSDGSVVMQVLPDRFEVAVVRPDRLDLQIEGLLHLVEVFQEYVGRRTIRSVGHNAATILTGTAEQRSDLLAGLVHMDKINAFLNSSVAVSGDLGLKFKCGRETAARLQVRMAENDDVALDVNFHFDLDQEGLTALAAAQLLPESLVHAEALFDSFMPAALSNGVQA